MGGKCFETIGEGLLGRAIGLRIQFVEKAGGGMDCLTLDWENGIVLCSNMIRGASSWWDFDDFNGEMTGMPADSLRVRRE